MSLVVVKRSPLLNPGCLWLSIIYFAAIPYWPTAWAADGGEPRKTLGDRLIVSVNSTPYTQRQIEVYLTVKEGLRDASVDSAPVLNSENWPAALNAFADDMIVHQEAHRVGSFQVTENAEKLARGKFEKRRSGDSAFATASGRLNIDDRTLTRTLNTVLRTEAFRRNKERQSIVARTDDDGAPRWFEEIKDRAVVRYFAGAEKYVEIRPVPVK